MPTWIQFNEAGPSDSGKTKTWTVVTIRRKDAPIDQRVTLGKIAWRGQWRKYCFFPSRDTVFEENCLRDIARFCEDATAAKKATPRPSSHP
jgi:hypothetical protein